MQNLLSVPERRTCRYHSQSAYISDNDIAGLYTDDFSECNIVVFYNRDRDNIKISMTHANRLVSPEQIAGEIDWVGRNCIKIIFRRSGKFNQDSQAVKAIILGDLINEHKFEEICFNDQDNYSTFSIGIYRDGSYNFYSRDGFEDIKLYTHPEEWRLQSSLKLNIEFGWRYYRDQFVNTKLLFDGYQWSELQHHDINLVDPAINFLRFFNNKIESANNYGSSQSIEIALEYKSMYQLDCQAPTVAKCALLLIKKNCQHIFNDEMNYLLEKGSVSEINFIDDIYDKVKLDFHEYEPYCVSTSKEEFNKKKNLTRAYNWCKRFQKHNYIFNTLTVPRATLFSIGCEPPPGSRITSDMRTIVPSRNRNL